MAYIMEIFIHGEIPPEALDAIVEKLAERLKGKVVL